MNYIKLLNYYFIIFLGFSCSQVDLGKRSDRHIANVGDCTKYVKKFKRLDQDSAVELELPVTNNLLDIITTQDGTIGGLIGDSPLPPWFLEKVSAVHGQVDNPYNVLWDSFNNQTKYNLVKYKTTLKKTSIFEERKIMGLKVRDELELDFPEPTTFLGKAYTAGKHKVDLKGVFGPVEYCCNNNGMKNFSMVELHFRTNTPAGQLSNDAWTLLEALKLKRNHQHVHVVGKIPIAKLTEQPEVYTALMGDFFRRSNLFAEMVHIYFYNYNISSNKTEKVIYFDYLSRGRLRGVTEYFSNRSKGSLPQIGDEFKMGWIGMRGSDKYDQPGLWGLEYRAISDDFKPQHAQIILDNLQTKMLNQDYGLSEQSMEHWLKTIANNPRTEDVPSQVSQLLYHRGWDGLIQESTQTIRKELQVKEFFSDLSTNEKMKKYSEKREQLKMLVFDWSKDPLFYNNPEAIERIEKAQIRAIKRFRNEVRSYNPIQEDSIKGLMRQFLTNSGIMEKLSESLGISLQSLK